MDFFIGLFIAFAMWFSVSTIIRLDRDRWASKKVKTGDEIDTVYVTTAFQPRTKLADLGYGWTIDYDVRCGGWAFRYYNRIVPGSSNYHQPEPGWLIIDLDGDVIHDSRPK